MILVGAVVIAEHGFAVHVIISQILNANATGNTLQDHATGVVGINPIGTAPYVWHDFGYNAKVEKNDVIVTAICSMLGPTLVATVGTGTCPIRWTNSPHEVPLTGTLRKHVTCSQLYDNSTVANWKTRNQVHDLAQCSGGKDGPAMQNGVHTKWKCVRIRCGSTG